MKLNENNANFAVVGTAFHGGGVISYHKSLRAAERSARCSVVGECDCGCCGVVPITESARREMMQFYRYNIRDDIRLLHEIPFYSGNERSPYMLCR